MPWPYHSPLILTAGILFAAILIATLPNLDERVALTLAFTGVVISLAAVAGSFLP